MGNVVQPHTSGDNTAKQVVDQQIKGLKAIVTVLFDSIRLGQATDNNLGYKLCGNKMIVQETNMFESKEGATSDNIQKALKSIFKGDWEQLASVAINEVIGFINQKPSDSAEADIFSKSYLNWESDSLIQNTVYIQKAKWVSEGTLAKDATSILLVGLAKGIVDYATVDPQIFMYEIRKSNPKMVDEDYHKKITELEGDLRVTSMLPMIKKMYTSKAFDAEAMKSMLENTGAGTEKPESNFQ
ncbi:uncharacterized protein [Clytia hemisphaerica]|uniref:Uncharacterized protein n=1 Tax=Clytia hemisphaerica TaxID=252671 RepID=A0A7M5X1W4_9CNID